MGNYKDEYDSSSKKNVKILKLKKLLLTPL